MRNEARILDLDGSHILTHYQAPIPNSKTQNPKSITCPDGGWVPPSKNSPWRSHGHGFNLVSLTTSTGLPLAKRTVRIHHPERATAIDLFQKDYRTKVLPNLTNNGLAVLTADSGLNSPSLRRELRRCGVIENIHLASHAQRETTDEHVATRNAARYDIEGYPNWQANGHRELSCLCGQGTTSRTFDQTKDGQAVARTEGRCPSCGSINVTSGQWYLAHISATGQSGFRRAQTGDEDRIDWTFGNPLTYNDPLSRIYGSGRFGHQEGFHGHLVTRFGLLREKGWYRSKAQAELDVVITFCVIHLVAMEQRRRARATNKERKAA